MNVGEILFVGFFGLAGLAFVVLLVTVIVGRFRSGTRDVDPASMNERIQAEKQYPAGYAAPGGPDRR